VRSLAEEKTMRVLAVTIAAALSACTGQPDKADAGASSTGRPAAEVPDAMPAPASIEGRWQVERVDGAPPVINIANYAPVVTIGAERIHFQSQCIYADWTYRRTSETLTTATYYEPGSGMCARGMAPGETAIQNALGQAQRIAPGPDGTLIIEGGGHRLELRPSELGADGRIGMANLAGEWRVAGIDGGEFNESYGLALSGSARELWWEPRCAGMARSYRLNGSAIDFGPRAGAPLAGGTTAPVCAIAVPPRLRDVMRSLDAATRIERTGENGVLISGGGHSVLLFAQ
jgi:hypothetical protein